MNEPDTVETTVVNTLPDETDFALQYSLVQLRQVYETLQKIADATCSCNPDRACLLHVLAHIQRVHIAQMEQGMWKQVNTGRPLELGDIN